MRKIAYVVGTIILTGCGGGGGSDTANTNSVPISPTSVVPEKPQFVEIPNALTTYNPYKYTATQALALDVNNDGRDDIILHHIAGNQVDGGVVGNTPCANIFKVYIMQPDNTFVDQTSSYIQGNDLGGCSRKIRVEDVNKDGKPDILFALNQEDGRMQINRSDMDAQNAVVLSQGASYKIVKFGKPSWYHSIGVGYDKDERMFVTGAGYSGNESMSYYFDNGMVESKSHQMHELSATSFELFNNSKTKKHTDLLMQAGDNWNGISAVGYKQNASGEWSSLGKLILAPVVAMGKGISYNGDDSGDLPIFNYKNYYFTFAGASETCQIRMTPESNKSIVFAMSGAVIPNYDKSVTNAPIYQSTLKKVVNFLRAGAVENDTLKIVELNIDNEQVEYNGNFFDCKDVNGDGYDDIVRYPFSRSGLPHIYLNNKNDGFTYVGTDKFPNNPTGWENNSSQNATSILQDFDKDGYLDLFVYAPHDVTGNTNITYKFYKGQKSL